MNQELFLHVGKMMNLPTNRYCHVIKEMSITACELAHKIDDCEVFVALSPLLDITYQTSFNKGQELVQKHAGNALNIMIDRRFDNMTANAGGIE